MTRQYNNSPTILCIYVLLVSSVGVSRHRLDTHWTPYTNSTDYPSLVAQTSFKKSGFLKFASVIGNSGIRGICKVTLSPRFNLQKSFSNVANSLTLW